MMNYINLMNNKFRKSRHLKMVFIMTVFLTQFGCAKRTSTFREPLKEVSALRTTTGVTAGNTTVLDTTGKNTAQRDAASLGISLDWVGTDFPAFGQTNDRQKYIYVVNVFRINGKAYEMATVHYDKNTTPIISDTNYLTVDNVDFDVDASCFDINCEEYLVSVKISKESQNIQQTMIYMDFRNRVRPVISVNDSSHFLDLNDFTQTIRKYFENN